MGLLIVAIVIFSVWLAVKERQIGRNYQERQIQRQMEKDTPDRLRQAMENWNTRVKQIQFEKEGKDIVLHRYSNSNDYYPCFIWREGDNLCLFPAEPTSQTCFDSPYEYPESLRIEMIPLSEIEYISRVQEDGKAIVRLQKTSINHRFFSLDSFDVFRKLFPEKS